VIKLRGKIPLIEGKGICKEFAGVWKHLILDHIDISIYPGEIHALLGENGAGKTVLANILSGFYTLSKGQIFVKGKPVILKSPRDGLKYGIGMVHQELALVGPFTLAENIALGLSGSDLKWPIPEIKKRLAKISEKFGLRVDPDTKIEDLSAGEQQMAEILKVLYHEPEVLILDEPTSLISQEAQHLFEVLREMAEAGYGILFITHKIEEALAISDRITVLRLGKHRGTLKTKEADEAQLIKLMFGEHTPIQLERKTPPSQEIVLEVKDLWVMGAEGETAIKGISFEIREGEIFGIAGISGNGQSELVEAIAGLRKTIKGRIRINGQDYTDAHPHDIIEAGVAHIPEKRREIGVVEQMPVAENIVLKDIEKPPFSKASFLKPAVITRHAREIVKRFGALVPDLWRSETRILSGGNIQRLLLGRETWKKPKLLVAAYPTHGLDAKAINHTWDLFMRLRQEGVAILLISEDLDEILALSDRIGVMNEGKLVAILDREKADKQKIATLMTKSSLIPE
jgi:simple sugar transport system ATP-binding protein